jgi:hypothetical protein
METIKFTPLGKSYWNENGAYQKEFDKLYEENVPSMGSANNLHGELIRACSRLVYEYCNNGNCNASTSHYETCPQCHGAGYEDYGGEYEDFSYCGGNCSVDSAPYMSKMYDGFIHLIEENVPETKKLAEQLREFICTPADCTFSNEEMKPYSEIVDRTVHYVLNNPETNTEYIGED